MDQIKIGSFIATCRKEKGLTQSQLAEMLGLSDKAISKWECGRSMPDLSIFMPLCDLLEITLNELLLGEYIEEVNLKEKSNQILMDVITQWIGKEELLSNHEEDEVKVLRVSHVKKIYQSESTSTQAICDVSFDVEKGSFVGIMGASGSGKTTLLNMVSTIDKMTSGQIEINGLNLSDLSEKDMAKFRREHLGFIFQEYNLLDTLTIYENIAMALIMKEVGKEAVKPTIYELAKTLEITEILDKYPYEVSGGQRQRCACARAIAMKPSLIIADEPTGALDSTSTKQLLETLQVLKNEYGATILMVTHDVLSASYCDRILFLKDGMIEAQLIRAQTPKHIFFTNILDKLAQLEEVHRHVL